MGDQGPGEDFQSFTLDWNGGGARQQMPTGLEESPVAASPGWAWSAGPKALWECPVLALALAPVDGLNALMVDVAGHRGHRHDSIFPSIHCKGTGRRGKVSLLVGHLAGQAFPRGSGARPSCHGGVTPPARWLRHCIMATGSRIYRG
jgi:hypothetical protein